MGLAKRRRHAIEQGFLKPRIHAPRFNDEGQMVPLCNMAGRSALVAQTPASVSCSDCDAELAAIARRQQAASDHAAAQRSRAVEQEAERWEREARCKGRLSYKGIPLEFDQE